MIRKLLILFCLLFSTAANAEWRQATSRNFIVYSEGSEDKLREFIARLEKLHFVLRTLQRVTRPAPPIKLRVFLMPNAEAVAATMASPMMGVQGYYDGQDRGPFLVGTRSSGGADTGLDPELVLQHEFTHHFMFTYFPATYPTWYVEGFAEFWGTTKILDKDVVEVGHPANHRFGSFELNRWMPLKTILSARSYGDVHGDVDLIYAEGWLLLRYLFEDKARAGQLQHYLTAINAGTPYEKAMDDAFGKDAKALDHELMNYAGESRFNVVRLPFKPIDVGPVTVRTLGPAEDALMPAEIRLTRGLYAREVPALAAEVRRVADRFPQDPYALTMLAEAERLNGKPGAAAAAADRALAARPDDPRALTEKGLAAAALLQAAKSTGAKAWESTRVPLARAVQLAPNDPLVLEAYYDSFTAQGVLAPAGGQNALFRAFELVPANDQLRYKLARDFEQRAMIEDAVAIIKPAALEVKHNQTEKERKERERESEKWRQAGYNVHETAFEMLERLQARLAKPAAVAAGH